MTEFSKQITVLAKAMQKTRKYINSSNDKIKNVCSWPPTMCTASTRYGPPWHVDHPRGPDTMHKCSSNWV